jgi:hypothetical protein
MSSNTSRRYPLELRERAVRMVTESRPDHGSEWKAMTSVASKLGVGSAEDPALGSCRGGGWESESGCRGGGVRGVASTSHGGAGGAAGERDGGLKGLAHRAVIIRYR